MNQINNFINYIILEKKVLVVAPSRNTRGGISTLVKTYELSYIWGKWNCKWIETYKDSHNIIKIIYFLKGFLNYLFCLFDFDIIHIHLSWWVSLLRKFPFICVAFLFNKKVILHIHSGSDKIISGKMQFLYRYVFNHADCTIVLSNTIKNDLIKYYKFKDIQVLYNPCNKEKINLNEREFSILFAGTLYSVKGYTDLIKAFAIVFERHKNWKLIIAGNGEIENATKLSLELGIAENVVLTGWINGETKSNLFNSSSIFCLPSYSEGFPMAVLDAISHALPVIITPVGALPEIFQENENALFFNPGDINDLARKIEMLINDNCLRDKLSKASLVLAESILSKDFILNQLDRIYLSF